MRSFSTPRKYICDKTNDCAVYDIAEYYLLDITSPPRGTQRYIFCKKKSLIAFKRLPEKG